MTPEFHVLSCKMKSFLTTQWWTAFGIVGALLRMYVQQVFVEWIISSLRREAAGVVSTGGVTPGRTLHSTTLTPCPRPGAPQALVSRHISGVWCSVLRPQNQAGSFPSKTRLPTQLCPPSKDWSPSRSWYYDGQRPTSSFLPVPSTCDMVEFNIVGI